MSWFEIVNPSDKVIIESDDPLIAAIAVLTMSQGKYGLVNESGDRVLPVFLMGGHESWLREKGINGDKELIAYCKRNATKLAKCLESAFYGRPSDIAALDAAFAKLPADQRLDARKQWNEVKRTSRANIGQGCIDWAERFREIAMQPEST